MGKVCSSGKSVGAVAALEGEVSMGEAAHTFRDLYVSIAHANKCDAF